MLERLSPDSSQFDWNLFEEKNLMILCEYIHDCCLFVNILFQISSSVRFSQNDEDPLFLSNSRSQVDLELGRGGQTIL